MELICKKAKTDDAETIYDLLVKSFEPYKKNSPKKAYDKTVMSPDEIKNRIEKNVFEVYKIVYNGQIIGTFSSTIKEKQNMYLRSMAVNPDFQNKGVGSYIIKQICKIGEENKYLQISLDTSITLKNAIHLYEKHGFEKTGKTTDFHGIDIIEMSKEL